MHTNRSDPECFLFQQNFKLGPCGTGSDSVGKPTFTKTLRKCHLWHACRRALELSNTVLLNNIRNETSQLEAAVSPLNIYTKQVDYFNPLIEPQLQNALRFCLFFNNGLLGSAKPHPLPQSHQVPDGDAGRQIWGKQIWWKHCLKNERGPF